MSKHTPGPWHIANGVQIRSNRDQIAKIWMMRDGEGRENARLIAAAPDLLDALKRCKFDSLNMTLEDREFCRAAIAKATGEQP